MHIHNIALEMNAFCYFMHFILSYALGLCRHLQETSFCGQLAYFLKFIRILLYFNPLLKHLFLALDCLHIQLAHSQLNLPSI